MAGWTIQAFTEPENEKESQFKITVRCTPPPGSDQDHLVSSESQVPVTELDARVRARMNQAYDHIRAL